MVSSQLSRCLKTNFSFFLGGGRKALSTHYFVRLSVHICMSDMIVSSSEHWIKYLYIVQDLARNKLEQSHNVLSGVNLFCKNKDLTGFL